MSTKRNLTCCCCGGPAPALKQWWNRDTGFGLCGKCAAMIKERGVYDDSEFKQLYGIEGVHWFPSCGKDTLAPDDLIVPCVLTVNHARFL